MCYIEPTKDPYTHGDVKYNPIFCDWHQPINSKPFDAKEARRNFEGSGYELFENFVFNLIEKHSKHHTNIKFQYDLCNRFYFIDFEGSFTDFNDSVKPDYLTRIVLELKFRGFNAEYNDEELNVSW